MTFRVSELKNVAIDNDDEWQIEDYTVSVKFYGLENFVCKMFDIDLTEQFLDGWIDSYAYIDPLYKTVTELYFDFQSNAGIENDRELNIKITNQIEGRMNLTNL